MSKEWHPDKHKGDKAAEQKFKEINEAYEVLSDPTKKQQYDQFGTTGNGAGGFGGGGFDFSSFGGGQGGMPDLEDLLGSFFGGGRRSGRQAQKGEDLEVQITISFAEVVTGTVRDITLRKLAECETCGGNGAAPGSSLETCEVCKGTGQVTRRAQSFFGTIEQRGLCDTCKGSGKIPKEKCKTCDGEGRVKKDVTVQVRVPAGINDGQALRVEGGGAAGRRGEKAGDLFVHVVVADDERFVREGDDVRTTLTVHVLQALLGDDIDIETVHGKMRIHVPEGTQPGHVLRLKGKGLPVLGTSRMGDHYVTIDVEIPKKLSRAERALLDDWKQLKGA